MSNNDPRAIPVGRLVRNVTKEEQRKASFVVTYTDRAIDSMKKANKLKTSITLSPLAIVILDRLAKSQGLSKSVIIQLALMEYATTLIKHAEKTSASEKS